MTFETFNLQQSTLDAIYKMGIKTPSKIQEESIPHIVLGKDVIGESATGSGKTLAFGVGIAEKVEPQVGMQCLVLTPTRELANQVYGEIKQLVKPKTGIAIVYGGVGYGPQISAMEKADVVVSTPGRLLDHMQQGNISLRNVSLLVLDEADRMFEMGFIDDIEKIISQIPKARQTLLYSATFSDQVKRVATRHMKNPIQIKTIVQVDPSKLHQAYYDIARNLKFSLLVHLLRNEKSGLVMVFCNTRRTVDFLTKNLQKNDVDAIAIHGGLSQNKRLQSLSTFDKGKAHVLVCTDVAARGLHIDNVSHVYNYEIPNDATDYIHRIGRTARAGKEGIAINLICDRDHENFGRVMDRYRDFAIDKIPKPQIEQVKVVMDTGRDMNGNPRSPNRGRTSSRGNPRGTRGGRPSSEASSRPQRN
ncbi:MAG: superfamily II DNA/RNA helicase [Candidatus Woesearchaeota archaeon]|jgi:superfamily II DNA/RNA helicase